MLTIKQIFELSLAMAVNADPRGKKGVQRYLARIKKEYEEMKLKDKAYFDTCLLTNPYADSRLHLGDSNAKVRRVLAGIDIGAGEILLASQLNERGKQIDLVIGHHPLGRGLAGLHSVMDIVIAVYEKLGLPVHVAEKLMDERVKEVARSVHPVNHFQNIDLARALNVSLMNTHTITDNLVKKYVRQYIEKRKPETVSDLIDVLLEIPEYQEAKRCGAGPKIFAGDPHRKTGKFIVEMTGGTNPSNKLYEELSRVGISTVIGMHMKDDAREKANEQHMNVVIAGHISSDSLGMNLFLDELEKRGIEIVPCGGLIRVSRVKRSP